MARSTSSRSTRRMLTMPWSGRRFAPPSVPLSAATCNRSSALFILPGVQKLVHVRTLDKMTTAACHVFFQEVDGIELQDLKKLKTLNFDR